MRTPQPIGAKLVRRPDPPEPAVLLDSGRHSDSYRLAQSFVFLLFLTAIDVTNALDLGSQIKYAVLLVPLLTLLLIRVRPGRGAIRQPVTSDRILLVLAISGFTGTMYGIVVRNVQSPSVTLFVPMLLAFMYVGTTEPMTEEESKSILRWLLLIGLVYVFLSAMVNSGVVASLVQYRQYRNATMFFVPLGFAAALGLRARLRGTAILVLAAATFVAYPSGTAALIVLTTVVTFLVTRPSGRTLKPWVVAAALLVALVFTALNFNKTVELTGNYFSLVGKRNNDVTRVALWHGALAEFDASPLVGNVFSGNTTIDVRVPVAGSPIGRDFQAPFHSDYLLLLANGGLLGLGLLLAWGAAVEVMAYRRYRGFVASGRASKAALVRAMLIGFNAYFCAMAFNPLFDGMSVAASLFAMYGLMMLVGDPRREAGTAQAASVVRSSRFDATERSGGRTALRENGAANGNGASNGHADRLHAVAPVARTSRPVVLPPAGPSRAMAAEVEALGRSLWSTGGDPPHETMVLPVPGTRQGPPQGPPPRRNEPATMPSFGSARSRLAGGSRWLLVARFGTLVLGLAINALLTRLLSPSDFGAYVTTYTLVVIGSTVAELGVDRTVVRMVAAAIGRGDQGRARNAIGKTFLVGSIGTVAVALALLAGGGRLLAIDVFRSPIVAGAIPLAVGWLVGTALMQLATESLRGLQRFALTSLFDWLLVDIITATVFGVAWVRGVHFTYGKAVLVSVVATAVAAVVGVLVIGRRARSLRGSGTQPLGAMLSVAWPLLVTNLGLFLVNAGVDIWILGAYRTQSEVALYGAAARIALLVAVPFTILLGTVPPLVAELHARERRGELERMLRIMATVTTVPAIAACAVFVAFGGPIMARFYGHGQFYARGASILAVLSLAQLVSVSLGACGITLMMTGHQRTMMLITIPSGLLSVAAAALLAPRFGGVGVASATACGIAVQNLLQLFFVHRYLGVWTMARPSILPVYQFFGRTREQREARRP